MEQYKEKLRITNAVLSICCTVLAIFAFLAVGSELGWFSILHPATGDSHWKSTWYGYVFGSAIGVFGVMLACIIRNCRALNDEKKLKKLYVQLHDERIVQIQTLARNTAMQILLCAGLVATVIAGYFSVTVSITIFICIWISSFVNLLMIGYYSKKM